MTAWLLKDWIVVLLKRMSGAWEGGERRHDGDWCRGKDVEVWRVV